MLRDKPRHGFGIEKPTPINDGGGKQVIDHVPKVARKPSPDWRGESCLAPVDHAVRYDSLHSALENLLTAKVPHLEC